MFPGRFVPLSVRHEVWVRSDGACVDCGSKKLVEFDHIVPLAKGGSSTASNLELRCETCRRARRRSGAQRGNPVGGAPGRS
jgi:5-methylcytosine-specific restriction endonuclease McrA